MEKEKKGIDWLAINQFHLRAIDTPCLDLQKRLVTYLHDNPGLTYQQYFDKARSYGLNPISREHINMFGLCLNDDAEQVIERKFTVAEFKNFAKTFRDYDMLMFAMSEENMIKANN